jgi:hypothetical protein
MTVQNETSTDIKGLVRIPTQEYYASKWEGRHITSGTFTTFNMSLKHYLGANELAVLAEVQRLQCQSAWAFYNFTIGYSNGQRTVLSDTSPGGALQSDLDIPESQSVWKDAERDMLNEQGFQTLDRLNQYAILDSIVTTIAGSLGQGIARGDGSNFSYTSANGSIWNMTPLVPDYLSTAGPAHDDGRISGTQIRKTKPQKTYHKHSHNTDKLLEPKRTWIEDTVFNSDRATLFAQGSGAAPKIVFTEALLNEVVANVTIAAMLSYYPLSVMNATVMANITTYRNVYSFSRPNNLILPYALSLIISLPFLIIGYMSLRQNGVAALSDSFLQLLVTITRSEELDRVARPCSLGGDEMAKKELKQTRIMFGELAQGNSNMGVSRRMGFGLEHEIIRVKKRGSQQTGDSGA